MNNRFKWGIDLGGTKIEAVILDSEEQNKIIERQRVPTCSAEGYEKVKSQIVKLVKSLEEKTGLHPSSIGIGTPGRLDPDSQTLKNSNSVCLNGQPVLQDLKDLLKIPIKLENDANCFTVSEANYLAQNSEEINVIFGVILGTGVGGGIVVNGNLISGKHGIGGEWGHNFLDNSGGNCYCGKVGCVETIISGPALERYYHSLSGQQIGLKEIAELATTGQDENATKTLDRLHHFFGLAFSNILNIIDPDIVVIGGGVGNIDSIYTEGVKHVEKHFFNNRLDTKFVKPHFGDSSGVIGAALL